MKPTKDPMVSLTVTIPRWVWRDLNDLAEKWETTKSKIVQDRLEYFLELQETLRTEQGE